MNETIELNEDSPFSLPRLIVVWILAHTFIVPLGFVLALFTMVITRFFGEALVAGVFGATAGAVVGFAQWLAIKRLNRVKFWIPLTIVGFALGIMLDAITGFSFTVAKGMRLYFSISMQWVLPAFLVALFQTVALFRAGIRAYFWPVLGSTTILFAGFGYNFGIFAFPIGLFGGLISAIALWVAIRPLLSKSIPAEPPIPK